MILGKSMNLIKLTFFDSKINRQCDIIIKLFCNNNDFYKTINQGRSTSHE